MHARTHTYARTHTHTHTHIHTHTHTHHIHTHTHTHTHTYTHTHTHTLTHTNFMRPRSPPVPLRGQLGVLLFLLLYSVKLQRILKTLERLVHAKLFCCFYNPPNSDTDCMIFNGRMRSYDGFAYVFTRGTSSKDFCRVCTEFHSGEVSGRVRSLARNAHSEHRFPAPSS